MFVNVNGQKVSSNDACLSVSDRGILLGDGLFETIRVFKGVPKYIDSHWQRLSNAAKQIDLKVSLSESAFKNHIKDLITANQLSTGGVRFTLTRGIGARGLWPETFEGCQFIIQTFELAPPKATYRLCYSGIRRDETNPLTYLKTLSYMDNIMIKKEAAEKGHDDGLSLNTKGLITETSMCNFFMMKADQLMTPPVSSGLLNGIMREQVKTYCDRNGISLLEQPLTPEMLDKTCSAFLTNSIIGIKPVTHIENIALRSHPLIERLSKAFYS